MLGTLLGGRYRLDAQIGRGGMSTVYRAFDTVLERPVAIKLMHREIASDSDQLERFRREARSVARLSHPHIVTVIDAGEEPSPDGALGGRVRRGPATAWRTPFIVLEYVEGETLKALIRRDGPLEIPQAIAYAIEIARALGAAHERLIVHRDVKPQNVLIGVEGGAKITDFGIARTLTEEGLTIDGRVLGTTDYVSPEQALGQSVTGQSDLYSLGIVLYEMLTGVVPFTGETPVAVAMRHVREDVPDVQLRAARGLRRDRRGRRSRDRQGPRAALPRRREHGRRPRGGARDRGLAHRPGHRGGHDRAAHAAREHPPAPAVAHAPPRALDRLARAARRDRRARADPRRRTRTAARGVAPDVVAQPGLSAGSARADGGPRLQPVRHRPRKPRQTTRTSSTATRTPAGAPSTTTTARSRRPAAPASGCTSTPRRASPAKQIEIQTPTPGFAVADLRRQPDRPRAALRRLDPARPRAAGAARSGADHDVRDSAHIPLALGGARYRYYLVWITTLPPGGSRRRSPHRSRETHAVPLSSSGAWRAALVALERQPAETVDQLRVGDPGGLHQLRVDARRGEAGHRVQLVHQHPLAVDEEVDPRQALAAGVRERLAARAPCTRARALALIRAGTISSMPPGVYFAS